MSYDEDSLIEQPAIKLFESMAWQVCNCFDETLGLENGTTGREERSAVVLVRRLYDAIERLNPDLDELLIADVVDELTRDRSIMSDIAANEEIYKLIKEGVKVESIYEENSDTITVKIIDWDNPENNDFS